MATPTVRELLRGTASGAGFTLTTDAGTAVGDVLVVVHAADGSTAANMVSPTPGTWTQQALGDIGASNSHIKVWTRPVTVGGAQTVTIPQVPGVDHGAHLYVLAGADTSGPVDAATGTTGAASTSHVAPSISPTTADALLLSAVVSEVFSFGNYTAVSGGMTDLAEDDLTPTSTFATLGSARQALTASGPTGTRTFTYSQSKAFAAVSVAIKGAGGGGATIAPDGVAVPVAVGAPTLTWSATVAPDGIAAPVALGSPSLTWSASVSPGGISAPVALGSPIVGAASINPDGIAVPVALGAPTLTWSGSITPDGIAVPVAVGGPNVGAAPIAPDGIGIPIALGAPSLTWSAAVSPDGISVPVVVGGPGLAITGGIITRPFTGTVTRTFGGSVLRPFTGLITRPFTGDITRP